MANGLINFFICFTSRLLRYTRHFCQFKHLISTSPTSKISHRPNHSISNRQPEGTTSASGYVCGRCKTGHSLAGADEKPSASQGRTLIAPRSQRCAQPSSHETINPRAFRCNASVRVKCSCPSSPHAHRCNTCQGCILGSRACHLIRSPFNSILSFI